MITNVVNMSKDKTIKNFVRRVPAHNMCKLFCTMPESGNSVFRECFTIDSAERFKNDNNNPSLQAMNLLVHYRCYSKSIIKLKQFVDLQYPAGRASSLSSPGLSHQDVL